MKLAITPETRVGEMLAAYPETEVFLVGLAPVFAKLRNPILRKTVAKVTTLEQAARIAGLPCRDFVDRLREAVGQSTLSSQAVATCDPPADCSDGPPDWACPAGVQRHLDADALLQRGEQPLGLVLRALANVKSGEVISVATAFYPAPLIDVLRNAGHTVFSKSGGSQTLTYVRRG